MCSIHHQSHMNSHLHTCLLTLLRDMSIYGITPGDLSIGQPMPLLKKLLKKDIGLVFRLLFENALIYRNKAPILEALSNLLKVSLRVYITAVVYIGSYLVPGPQGGTVVTAWSGFNQTDFCQLIATRTCTHPLYKGMFLNYYEGWGDIKGGSQIFILQNSKALWEF